MYMNWKGGGIMLLKLQILCVLKEDWIGFSLQHLFIAFC